MPSREPEVKVNSKGVTTMTYDVWKALDHSAICQALGLPFDRATRKPKRTKR